MAAHKSSKLCLLLLLISAVSSAQLAEAKIDELVARTMETFNVPGIAVGIIKDGKVVLAKGYGVTNINTQQKTDANTLFGIASNTKAFTTAALGMLVDEGKLKWDDKVISHIPEFRMYNDYVTAEFTIRDLLTHRSGLGLGAGDLMIWPDGHNFTPQDIIRNIRYLKPVSAFRTQYDYDNLLYVIAGEVVHRVSGMPWNDFVEQRIIKPLHMDHTATSWVRLKDTSNTIVPHVPVNGKLQVIPRYKNQIFDAAAGIYSSVNDLSNWVIMQLQNGKFEDRQLLSEKQHKEMWTPQTIMPLRNFQPYKSLFKAYGLGWQLTDINGKLQVSHTGGLDGIVTQVILFPEIQLGIIVLTNQQSGAAFTAISNTIKDSYLGISNPDHVAALSADRKMKEENADSITAEVWTDVAKNAKDKKNNSDFVKYAGTYRDNWFGDVEITVKKGRMYFASKRSPRLSGEVFRLKDDNFVVKWNVRSFGADSHIFFRSENDKISGFTMKAISPLTDFSYDFHDLDFTRVAEAVK